MSGELVDIPGDERSKLIDFWGDYNAYIEYQGEYYSVVSSGIL